MYFGSAFGALVVVGFVADAAESVDEIGARVGRVKQFY